MNSGNQLNEKWYCRVNRIRCIIHSIIGTGDDCDRKPNGGKADNGFYPLFGVTSCTPEELENINKIRGSRGSCAGESAGTGILDQMFN